ncbi:hypothetical protein HOD08_04820 [bacterium]|nr:hypothetical protein [bacterium]
MKIEVSRLWAVMCNISLACVLCASGWWIVQHGVRRCNAEQRVLTEAEFDTFLDHVKMEFLLPETLGSGYADLFIVLNNAVHWQGNAHEKDVAKLVKSAYNEAKKDPQQYGSFGQEVLDNAIDIWSIGSRRAQFFRWQRELLDSILKVEEDLQEKIEFVENTRDEKMKEGSVEHKQLEAAAKPETKVAKVAAAKAPVKRVAKAKVPAKKKAKTESVAKKKTLVAKKESTPKTRKKTSATVPSPKKPIRTARKRVTAGASKKA